MANRYPNALWRALQKRRRDSVARRKAAIGLAAKSWWNIAQALGLPVKGGRFTAAIASTGKVYPENVAVSRTADTDRAGLAFENLQPTINLAHGAAILQTAVNGRTNYFRENFRRGVFRSLANTARAYPGLKLL